MLMKGLVGFTAAFHGRVQDKVSGNLHYTVCPEAPGGAAASCDVDVSYLPAFVVPLQRWIGLQRAEFTRG